MLVVVDPSLLVNGVAAPGSDAAKLLTLFAFAEAAKAIDEAADFFSWPPGCVSKPAGVLHASALERWQRFERSLPQAVTDDWELATSVRLLWQMQRIVGAHPSLGLDARDVENRIRRLTAWTVFPPEIQRLRNAMVSEGQETCDVVEAALLADAPYVIVDSSFFQAAGPPRFVRRQVPQDVTFHGRTASVMTLSYFKEHVLPFPLDLVDDREAAA